MTVLMTANRSHALAGAQCRIEWQGLAPDDVVSARLRTGDDTTVEFPAGSVPGLRPQPYVPHAWLLDLAQFPAGWQQLDLVVQAPAAHGVSLALEVRPTSGAAAQALQHSGLTTIPQTPMLALRVKPEGGGWVAVPYEAAVDDQGGGGGGINVPDALREAAVLARHERVVRSGEQVTAVIDLSASMRPQLAAGTVARVLVALQAVAGAADQRGLSVVAVSDRAHEPRTLRLDDDPEEFLRGWAQEIGLRTGARGTAERWLSGHQSGGLVVTVTDQALSAPVAAGRNCRIQLLPAGSAPGSAASGTVALSEPRPDPVRVVRALAHASPAA